MDNHENHNEELLHYGVKGMKWGVRRDRKRNPYLARKIRGHAGPGVYLGSNERRLAGAKKDLARLDRGEHLSIGATKKRQAMYDQRDRRLLEKKIAKLQKKMEKVKVKDLQKQYGNLEDQMTYGKNADTKRNAQLEREMARIERELNKLQ